MADIQKMTTASAIAKSLLANNVDTLFCLPGVQNDQFFNAIYDEGAAFRVIHTRHEQGAAYMALGAALATGQPAVYSVVPGPGFLNTTAALATAYSANAKVLCLSGQIPSTHIDKQFGLLHEIRGQQEIMQTMTKWSARINKPGEAASLVNEAFTQLQSGRPRPVGLECAPDILAMVDEVELLPPAQKNAAPLATPEHIAQAVSLLTQAKHPMIFVGGGALDAADEVTRLAELVQAPVISSRMGHGILDRRHYLSHTNPAAHQLWRKADVVLAIGSRLQMPQMAWGVDADLKVIQINIDAEDINRINTATLGINADAKAALALLISAFLEQKIERASIEEDMLRLRQEFAEKFSVLGPQMAFLKAIRSAIPDEGILVDELTQVGFVSRFAYPVYQPRTFLSSGYQGNLGWGFATAMGAKAAKPEVPVVSISGDGGFMYNVQELATAVLHKIGVVVVVFNDQAFGNVKRMQQELYGNRMIASELHNPDFVAMAQSFGARGVKVETADALEEALLDAFKYEDQPTLIEVPVGEMPSPWPFIQMERVRG